MGGNFLHLIEIMINRAVIVLGVIKEVGGTMHVISPISMVVIWEDNIPLTLMG